MLDKQPVEMQGEAALESLLEAIKDNVDPAAPEKRAEDTPTGDAYHGRADRALDARHTATLDGAHQELLGLQARSTLRWRLTT
jgi:hypothetical protein